MMPPGAAIGCACVSTLSWVSKIDSFFRVGCGPPRAVNGAAPPRERTSRPGAPGTDLEHVCEVVLQASNSPQRPMTGALTGRTPLTPAERGRQGDAWSRGTQGGDQPQPLPPTGSMRITSATRRTECCDKNHRTFRDMASPCRGGDGHPEWATGDHTAAHWARLSGIRGAKRLIPQGLFRPRSPPRSAVTPEAGRSRRSDPSSWPGTGAHRPSAGPPRRSCRRQASSRRLR